MKLIIETQVYENYGAHDWDGTGECPSYWKAKGGCTYHVEGIDFRSIMDTASRDALVKAATEKVAVKNDYVDEYVIDWHFEEDGYLSQDEELSLKYDGKVYPDPRITL